MLVRYGLAQSLKRPGCSGMSARAEVNRPARSMLQSHQHIEESKTGSHRDQEIASDNGSSVVSG